MCVCAYAGKRVNANGVCVWAEWKCTVCTQCAYSSIHIISYVFVYITAFLHWYALQIWCAEFWWTGDDIKLNFSWAESCEMNGNCNFTKRQINYSCMRVNIKWHKNRQQHGTDEISSPLICSHSSSFFLHLLHFPVLGFMHACMRIHGKLHLGKYERIWSTR